MFQHVVQKTGLFKSKYIRSYCQKRNWDKIATHYNSPTIHPSLHSSIHLSIYPSTIHPSIETSTRLSKKWRSSTDHFSCNATQWRPNKSSPIQKMSTVGHFMNGKSRRWMENHGKSCTKEFARVDSLECRKWIKIISAFSILYKLAWKIVFTSRYFCLFVLFYFRCNQFNQFNHSINDRWTYSVVLIRIPYSTIRTIFLRLQRCVGMLGKFNCMFYCMLYCMFYCILHCMFYCILHCMFYCILHCMFYCILNNTILYITLYVLLCITLYVLLYITLYVILYIKLYVLLNAPWWFWFLNVLTVSQLSFVKISVRRTSKYGRCPFKFFFVTPLQGGKWCVQHQQQQQEIIIILIIIIIIIIIIIVIIII